MSGLNPGTVGAIVSLTIDQSQARRLGIDFSTREVKSLDPPSRQRTNTACCCFSSLDHMVWNRFNTPSAISSTRDIKSQCSSSTLQLSPTKDITSQCSNPASAISHTGDITRQYTPPAVANIPHMGYLRPVPQSAVANIPHQGYQRPVPSLPSPISPNRDSRDQ
ncbi:hypothetical protein PoB_006529400 [Plakobranchus ocellatus]|uniref:Uncharacterized protein n=1 Tax=Plakobranchus ocellatus TaxID=259542 RepID=A0AAV4D3R7_9GAST|nr:hypothetical protein PoB_006529400 [Plakobranchus ocellatus]